MNKITNTPIKSIFILSIATFMLYGCGVATPIITATPLSPTVAPLVITPTQPSPTAAPPYIHYSPPKWHKVHLEFDYPGSWVLEYRYSLTIVSLLDPRFRTLPTRAPNEAHGTPSDFGSVAILIQDANLETIIEAHKQGYSNAGWITVLNDYKITINGYDAYVFEYQVDSAELYASVMFERDIFFAIKDQVYQIIFLVAEKDRGGDFEQGYEYFFNSLKIVP